MNAFQRAATMDLDLDAPVRDQAIASLASSAAAGPGHLAGHVGGRRRGWLVRRALLAADIIALIVAFTLAGLVVAGSGDTSTLVEFAILLATIPVWIVAAKLYGFYDSDEERVDHSTVDEIVGVFHLVTLGTWFYFVATWTVGVGTPYMPRLIAFWLLAIVLVTAARSLARAAARKSTLYLQNTIIIGAGHIGQLTARKLLQHPEYGLNLVGFLDDRPMERRPELSHIAVLGTTRELSAIVSLLDVERVIIAFSNESDLETMSVVRKLRELDVQIDLVPRMFELVGPNVGIHSIEGLPLVGLPPVRLSPSSRLLKRTIDLVGASIALIVTAPLFAYIAVRTKLDSPGPILFRQTRLGLNMREFTAFKFRTMYVQTDDSAHREYIKQTMDSRAAVGSNGLYKLERHDSITPFGAWLRKTSLDELPQLLNVLRGDMSLVGPRPCIPYETEHFSPHQFERFLLPAGITGLWQVTARARASFGEALDMDVAYVRGWSIGLDLRLLCRTPLELLRQGKATA